MYLFRHALLVALTLSILSGCATHRKLSAEETRLTRLTEDLSRRGDTASVVTLYERAVVSMPGNPDMLLGLGQAYLRNGDPKAASETFRKVYRLRDGDPEAVLGLGYAALLEGNTERAYALISDAAPKLNTYAAFNLLGITATLTGNFAHAHEAFNTAEALDKDNLEIKSNQALAYALDNDFPNAIQKMANVMASPLAEPHHARRQVLILVLANEDQQAEQLLQGMPKKERSSLLGQARRIRAISDPARRAAAIGLIPTFATRQGAHA